MPRGRRYDYDYDPYDPYGPRSCVGVPYRDDAKWVDPSRTNEKASHPYSYSEFFLFGSREIIKEKGVQGVYSDRVHTWWYDGKKDSKDFDKLWAQHVGTRYALATPAALSAFFTEYNRILWPKDNKNKRAEVVACAEGCNPSNGYPYWIVWYKTHSVK